MITIIVIADVCWSDIETITDFGDQWIRNILNKMETGRKIQ